MHRKVYISWPTGVPVYPRISLVSGDKDNSFRGLKITADGKYMYIRESDLLKIFDVETLQVFIAQFCFIN